MVKFIECWIMDSNGLPLFHAIKDNSIETVDMNMVSGLLSAFLTMYSVGSNENLEAIKFKGSKLIFVPFQNPYNLITVARVEQKEKDKNVHKELEKLTQTFIGNYGSIIRNWKGNQNLFLEFSKNLEKIML